MILIENRRTDPFFNLAVEDYFFKSAPLDEDVCLLWRNEPTVVVGRNQNAFAEVNLPFLEREGVRVVRRLTGGGAVYHDLGNLNYSFIAADPGAIDFAPMVRPVLTLLKRLGVPAELAGRNDLVLDAAKGEGGAKENLRKFSGSAQARLHGRLLHHGTLLFSVDLARMGGALSPDPDKFRSHAVASVAARVANLADFLPSVLTLGDFERLLSDEIEKTAGEPCVRRGLSAGETRGIEELRAKKYSRWEWNFGESPKSNFSARRRFAWGTLQVDFYLERGRIESASLTGDFFAEADPRSLAALFVGLPFERRALEERIDEAAVRAVFPALDRAEFFTLIFEKSPLA